MEGEVKLCQMTNDGRDSISTVLGCRGQHVQRSGGQGSMVMGKGLGSAEEREPGSRQEKH